MVSYLPRMVDAELARRLRTSGAVLVEGPKAVGKTVTASRQANSVIHLDRDPAARAAVGLDARRLFRGATPILLDEWQVEPDIWNQVRREVDDRQGKGHFILTGSATPKDDVNRHSGAGRFSVLRMRPMTLFETGHSSGSVSLKELFGAPEYLDADAEDLSFEEIVQRIVVGGWPETHGEDEDVARDWLEDYLAQIAEVDIYALGPRRNPRNVRRLLASLGRAVGHVAKRGELAKDIGGEDGPIALDTVDGYLRALDRLHLTENAEPWQPHMRSRSRLRRSPVKFFIDPSLGLAALDVGSEDLMADRQALGFHFESLVLRDLRVYSQPMRGRVDSWRDSNGHEVDAIVSVRGNRWGAFEVKMNPKDVDAAAASLLRFASKVDTSHHGEPAFLGVITSRWPYAYRRPEDGVYVIPITALGP